MSLVFRRLACNTAIHLDVGFAIVSSLSYRNLIFMNEVGETGVWAETEGYG